MVRISECYIIIIHNIKKEYLDRTVCAYWIILHAFLPSTNFFQKSLLNLDRDQVRHLVWSDLGSNCLKILSAGKVFKH